MKNAVKRVIDQGFISSIKDPRITLAREVTSKAGRLKHRKMMLYGQEQIRWALEHSIDFDYVLCTKMSLVPADLQEMVSCYEVSEGVLKKATDTNYLIPLIAIAYFPSPANGQVHDFIVVLDNVVDFGNIGTIVRTAQSFGVRDFAATSDDLDLFQRKAIDASRGSVFGSYLVSYKNPKEAIRALKEQGYQIVVTSPHASHLQSQVPLQKKPVALVVGNETEGICDELMQEADLSLQIPMAPHIESLNVGVATGISVYELKFRMALLMLRENIFQTFGRRLNVAGKLVQMVFDKKIKKVTGLTGDHVILLMICECDTSMTHEQISKDSARFGDDLTAFLEPLRTKNFLNEHAGAFTLTQEGKQFLAQLWPLVEQANQEILQGFSDEEKELLKSFLLRIDQACTELLSRADMQG